MMRRERSPPKDLHRSNNAGSYAHERDRDLRREQMTGSHKLMTGSHKQMTGNVTVPGTDKPEKCLCFLIMAE